MREWKDYDDGLDYGDLVKAHKVDRKLNHDSPQPITKQIRAAVAGVSPLWIFAIVLMTTLVVLAAVIAWHTAHDSKNVNVDKVDIARVELSGADDLGGIGPDEYAGFDYSVTNKSSQQAYVFIRVDMETSSLYELVDVDGWCKVFGTGNQLVFGYGTSSALTPVDIRDYATLTGRLHCLADEDTYLDLNENDMDFKVYGCLVYWTGDGNENRSASYLYQKYLDNGGE